MAYVADFTSDNAGSPDGYTVQTTCRRVRVQEKDRTVATLARFNVYFPGSTGHKSFLEGEEFIFEPNSWQLPGISPFSIETVNVGSTVFSITEE